MTPIHANALKNKINYQVIEILLAFFFCSVMLIICAISLWKFYQPHISLSAIQSQFIVDFANDVKPKPREQFVFLWLIVSLPLFLLISVYLASFVTQYINIRLFYQTINVTICSIFLIMIWMLTSYSYVNEITHQTYSLKTIISRHVPLLLVGILCLPILFGIIKKMSEKVWISRKYLRFFFYLAVISLVIFQSFSFRIYTMHAVDQTGPWTYDFLPVFYDLSQEVVGKTLLVHFPALYGMYSELLSPLFQLIGLSIFKFTLLMGVLQITALLALFVVMLKIMKSYLIIFIGMVTLIFMTGMTWYFALGHGEHPYFQYYPIRFFFPAVSIFLMLKLIKKFDFNKIVFIALFSGLALIWNLDSSVPVLGTLIAYLASFILFPTFKITRMQALKNITIVLALVISVFITFLFYLQLKSGLPLNLSWIIQYQKIFYQSGYMMLPTPLNLHPWMAVIAIYLIGLLCAVRSWVKSKRIVFWDLIFCLSILGLGLFSYFQGRSHLFTLITASWPAIVILFMLADSIIRLAKFKMASTVILLSAVPVLIFGIIITGIFIEKLPFFYKNFKKNMTSSQSTVFTRNLQFIREQLRGESTVIILSPNQSAYFAELGKASALNGPGLGEIFLQVDLEMFQANILASNTLIFLDENENQFYDKAIRNSMQHYKLMAASHDKMLVFKRM